MFKYRNVCKRFHLNKMSKNFLGRVYTTPCTSNTFPKRTHFGYDRCLPRLGRVSVNPSSKSHGAKSTRDSEQDQWPVQKDYGYMKAMVADVPLLSVRFKPGRGHERDSNLISWHHKTDCPDHRSLFKHSSSHVSSSSSIIYNT
ncbi:hypothetical protein N1851_024979 [Merluccius polli]|uniref:Uncharacterized protein n=1 Tax=Merluccius polli TaxID=89951 RepID=A0AA47NWC6_MERPO|nr:hypothetical protein N1851_024979 [Merluccius polli]